MIKSQCAAALAFMLGACGTPPSRPPAHQEALPPPNPPASVGVRYRIDPRQSELRVLVYRAGAMSALGHNHVIVNHALTGWVRFAGTPAGGIPATGLLAGASFELTVPVSGFLVDDSRARNEEGDDFSERVADDAKDGTLRNMLSPALLDASEFPDITVQSEAMDDSQADIAATVALKVAGHESHLTVPFTLSSEQGRLSASGSFNVRQTALGLAPFSIFMGALRVQDEMRVKFKLEATADQASNSSMSNTSVPSGAVSSAAGRWPSGI